MTVVQQVFQAALGLPEKDRATLASELLATLPQDVDAEDDELFMAELERRADEARTTPESTVSWSEVMKK